MVNNYKLMIMMRLLEEFCLQDEVVGTLNFFWGFKTVFEQLLFWGFVGVFQHIPSVA